MVNDSTPLIDSATQLHEFYTALVAAGFGRSEALQLVAAMMTASQQSDSSG